MTGIDDTDLRSLILYSIGIVENSSNPMTNTGIDKKKYSRYWEKLSLKSVDLRLSAITINTKTRIMNIHIW